MQKVLPESLNLDCSVNKSGSIEVVSVKGALLAKLMDKVFFKFIIFEALLSVIVPF